MPRVPEYDGLQVGANQLPNAQVRGYEAPVVAGKDASAIGQGMMDAGSALTKAAVRQLELDNQALLDKQEAAARQHIIDFTKTAVDRKGENASGMTDDFSQGFNKFTTEQMGSLPQHLKPVYERRVLDLAMDTIGKFSRYEAEQKHVARLANNEALTKLMLSSAANAPHRYDATTKTFGDGAEFETAKAELFKTIDRHAELIGLGKESDGVKNMRAEALSRIYAERVTALMNNDPANALSYFKGVREHIRDPNVRKNLDDAATRLDRQTRIEGEVKDWFYGSNPGDRNDLPVWINQTYNGADRTEALNVFKDLKAAEEFNQNEGRRANANTAWTQAINKGKVDNSLKLALSQTDHQTYTAIEAYLKNKRGAGEGDRDGHAKFNDPDKFKEVLVIQSENPDAFRNLDLNQYRPYLTRSTWEGLLKDQAKVPTLSDQRIARVINTEVNILKKPSDRAIVKKLVSDDITAAREEGTKVDEAFVKSRVFYWLQPGEVDGSGILWDDKGPRYKFYSRDDFGDFKSDKPMPAAGRKDIPRETFLNIQKRLRENGLPASDADVFKAYNARPKD